MLDELTLAGLHAVGDHEAEVVFTGDSLESHHHLSDESASFIEGNVLATEMLTEGVHHDELQIGKGLDDLLKLLLQQGLVALVQDANEMNP